MGSIRQGDARCLAGTVLVVVFFTCVFVFTLSPRKHNVKMSTEDMSRDELIKLGSQPDGHMGEPLSVSTVDKTQSNSKDSKKSGSRSISKQEASRHKLKNEWLKDELPKEENNQREDQPENNEAQESVNAENEKTKEEENKEGKSKKDETPKESKSDVHELKEESGHEQHKANTETREKTLDEVVKSVKEQTAPAHTGESTRTGRPEAKIPKSSSSKPASNRKIGSITDLNSTILINFASPFIEDPESERSLKKIITWYSSEKFSFKRKPFDGCPVSSCKVVNLLPEGVQADAVLFHDVQEESPPPREHKDQVFVFYEMDSPESESRPTIPAEWSGVFNWTWSYRRDADIWQPMGMLRRQPDHKILSMEHIQDVTRDKSRLIVWLSNTCPSPTHSKRDEYVTKLANHVRVHRLGVCDERISCGRDDSNCADTISKKYFFLLVLEDDICKDHVTEVFFRAWEDGMNVIPVVRGGADYATYFPPGTFINADWFDSAQQLGDYLIQLANNKKLYNEILWRKTHWILSSRRGQDYALCYLCKMLHQIPSRRKHYPDISRWYEHNACRPPKHF